MSKRNSRIEKSSGIKARGKVGIVLKIILILFLAIILAAACYYLVELKKADGDTTRAAINVLQNVASTVVDEEPVYVLLLGYSTDQGLTLTDTIILTGYNPQTQKAFMVSIPRDTFVGSSLTRATSYDKINALYSNEGADDTVNAVEEITGVDIDYYVTVNTDALIEIVDILGGVEFYVPMDMKYDDRSQNLHINLEEGLQTLDGKQAEGLLRFRHNNNGTTYDSEYGDNDYGRMRTQRDFIMAVAEQTIVANDLSKLEEIVGTIFDNLVTDCPMSVILSYLTYVYDFDMDNLETNQVPGTSVLANDLWVFEYDEEETEEMMQTILEHFNSETPNAELIAAEEEELNSTNEVSNDIYDESSDEDLNGNSY